MTLPALTAAAFALAVFLIVLAIRTWQKERYLLYVATPLLLGFALATGIAIDRLLGYATNDLADLHAEFSFVAATGDDPFYLLAVPQGSVAPRLYAIPKSMLSEDERRQMAQAKAKSEKGVPEAGKLSAEGDLHLYDFDVAREIPKSG